MEAFRELGLYGERRRTDENVGISEIFPSAHEVLIRSYRPEGDTRRYSIGVYLTTEPPAVIAVEQASNTLDGFITISMKIVSPEHELIISKIKEQTPYLSDVTPRGFQASGA